MTNQREIRDPIHNFIRLDPSEIKALDSAPFQRLRNIHQLALTYLLYPGATHRRFEHSLGVMELAGRVYDVVTDQSNIKHDSVKDVIPYDLIKYWRRTLRMAALCHDLGHLPFSHAAESHLLPDGWNHELLTMQFIRSGEMKPIWDSLKVNPEDVAKLAVGPEHYKDKSFTDWEAILAEIIVGGAFGVDRIDYLLRDSYHIGVAYGKFDHYRLIDTLRILPREYRSSEEEPGSLEPTLGVEEGGLHSAESLLLARYFMFSQVYCHHVRRIYDIHLMDFLQAWLPGGQFSRNAEELLRITDNEVTSELLAAARDTSHPAHVHAKRVVRREHFRLLYQRNPEDQEMNRRSSQRIFNAACDRFGDSEVRYDSYRQKSGGLDFPVLVRDKRIMSSLSLSDTLARVPVVATDYVFVSLEYRKKADIWLRENRKEIIASKGDEDE